MQLTCEHRRVGDAEVATCVGRIVAGPEAAALQDKLDTLGQHRRHVVLHLGGVDFIDSCGLGLLVRYLLRAHRTSGTLTVCAVSPKIDEVLRITRLKAVFPRYESEADAITSVHRPDAVENLNAVLAADNLPDALVLLVATRPKVVVVSAELYAARKTRTAEEFHRLASSCAVVELPPGFSGHEAVDAAQEVPRAVGAGC